MMRLLATRDDVNRIVEIVQPGLRVDQIDWRPLAPGATRRMIKKRVLVALVVSAVLGGLVWRPWGAAAFLVLLPLAIWHARIAAARMGWSYAADRIVFRSGVLTRKLSAVPVGKIHAVKVTQTPFDRRYTMARLRVDTAGAGPAGHKVAVPYLEHGIAQETAAALVRSAEAVGFRW